MCTFGGYNPDTDIPDLAGKVILITGGRPSFTTNRMRTHHLTQYSQKGTSGIGKTAVQELAKHNPRHIYFTGRNQQAADALIASLPSGGPRATFLPCGHVLARQHPPGGFGLCLAASRHLHRQRGRHGHGAGTDAGRPRAPVWRQPRRQRGAAAAAAARAAADGAGRARRRRALRRAHVAGVPRAPAVGRRLCHAAHDAGGRAGLRHGHVDALRAGQAGQHPHGARGGAAVPRADERVRASGRRQDAARHGAGLLGKRCSCT